MIDEFPRCHVCGRPCGDATWVARYAQCIFCYDDGISEYEESQETAREEEKTIERYRAQRKTLGDS